MFDSYDSVFYLRLDYSGWGLFAVPMQTSSISLFNRYSNKNYISLDSQRIMLYHDIHYGDVKNEIEVWTKREF